MNKWSEEGRALIAMTLVTGSGGGRKARGLGVRKRGNWKYQKPAVPSVICPILFNGEKRERIECKGGGGN